MKSKKISFIEIISVILILIVSFVIIKRIVVIGLDNKNSQKYIDDVNVFVEKATNLYKQEAYRNDTNYFTKINGGYIISLDKITDVDITKDPYGNDYKKQESYITFKDKEEEIIINVKSCKTSGEVEKCREIVNVNAKDLSTKSIKASIK